MIKKYIVSFFEVTLIIFFLGVVLVPPLKSILTPHEGWSRAENRELIPLPGFPQDFASFLNFPQQFEAYYNDHFGFREKFIHRYQREIRKWFGKAGSPRVVQGDDGWLFFTGNDLLEDYRGTVSLSTQELATWQEEHDKREQWLRERGVRYLLFIAPNKQSIYSEYLPQYFDSTKGKTRFEQLLNFTNKELPSYMLNLHAVLRDAKSQLRIYHKTGTHWNMLGAYVAFKHILARIEQWYPDEQFISDFSFHDPWKEGKGEDLAKMLMMEDTLTEKRPCLKREHTCAEGIPFDLQLSNIDLKKVSAPLMKGCPTANLKAVIFGDSFFNALEPFFSENFQQVVYVWKKFDQDNMEQLINFFQPDIVIEERVERNSLG